MYHGATIVKFGEEIDGLISGIVDVAWLPGDAAFGRFPLYTVTGLPFLGFTSHKSQAYVSWKLLEKFPEMQAEFKDFKVLVLHGFPPQRLLTAKKPITKLEDMQGLKARVAGGPPTELFKALGAVPVVMAMSEIYPALEKGVIDGGTGSFSTFMQFGMDEVTKYLLEDPLFISTGPIIMMHRDRWDSLPPDYQEAMLERSGIEGSWWHGDLWFGPERGIFFDRQKEKGWEKEVTELSPEELARWKEIGGRPIWDKWAAGMDAKGLPGTAVLEEALRLIDEYNEKYGE